MTHGYSIAELAAVVGGVLRGQGGGTITGVADLAEAQAHQASWLSRPEYRDKLAASRAGVVLLPRDCGASPMPAILCDRMDRAVARLLGAFAPPPSLPDPGIHPAAVVDSTVRIGADARIGPHVVIEAEAAIGNGCVLHAGVYIGRGTRLGDGCVLWPHVVVRDGCVLGDRVIIHPNAVIGADGFGYYLDDGRRTKVPHIGGVRLGDDVEIGACACVDRSKFGETVIGRGTKIDNLVQIGHNVRIGAECAIAALAAVAGSVRIGDRCTFGGHTAAADHVRIGNDVTLAGGLAVAAKNIPDGMMVSGWPAQEHRKELRDRAAIRRLPALAAQLREIIARIEHLEASTDDRSGGGV